jgi:hypothetical protein
VARRVLHLGSCEGAQRTGVDRQNAKIEDGVGTGDCDDTRDQNRNGDNGMLTGESVSFLL